MTFLSRWFCNSKQWLSLYFCRLQNVNVPLRGHVACQRFSPKEIQDLLIQSFSHIVCEIPSGFDASFFSIKMIFDSFFVDDVADNE